MHRNPGPSILSKHSRTDDDALSELLTKFAKSTRKPRSKAALSRRNQDVAKSSNASVDQNAEVALSRRRGKRRTRAAKNSTRRRDQQDVAKSSNASTNKRAEAAHSRRNKSRNGRRSSSQREPSLRPGGKLRDHEQHVFRFSTGAPRGKETSLTAAQKETCAAERDVQAQLNQHLNLILRDEQNRMDKAGKSILKGAATELNSMTIRKSSETSNTRTRAEITRTSILCNNYINSSHKSKGGSTSSQHALEDFCGWNENTDGLVPANIGLDSQANINIIRVDANDYDLYFPFGTTRSKESVSWTGGGSKRLPFIGTAIIPMLCTHRGRVMKTLIPVENCYAVRTDDFSDSLLSLINLTAHKHHSLHTQSGPGGQAQYLKLLDTNGNARKIHVRTRGGRWWLPCVSPMANTGREFTGAWCNSLSMDQTPWADTLEVHRADQHELLDAENSALGLRGAGNWEVPKLTDDPRTSIRDDFLATQEFSKMNTSKTARKSVVSEPLSDDSTTDGTVSRPNFIITADSETDSEDGDAELKADDDEEGHVSLLPTFSNSRVSPSITSPKLDDPEESIKKTIIRVLADITAGASIKDNSTATVKKSPQQATYRPSREQVHSYLCHQSNEVCEKSANHWSNTVVTGPRAHRRDCETCNICNSRKGGRKRANVEDEAKPRFCGQVIQFDLQTWNDPSLGGEKIVLRGIEPFFGLAFATYHLTRGAAEIIHGAETILDEFEKYAGGNTVERIVCDVEGALFSNEFKEICRSRHINLDPHTANSPEDTGSVERLNQTINAMRKACLFTSKLHDGFRFIADRHCMKVRNAFIVSGSRPAPPLTCSTGRATSPKYLFPWFSDIWAIDTHRIAKNGLIKDDTTRTRGYYVGFDNWGILVFDPLSGNIIRCGRRQFIVRERFTPRDNMPLDVTAYEADPCNFQRPDFTLNKGKTVSAWAQGKIPWTLLSGEERRRIEVAAKRSKAKQKPFDAKRDVPLTHRNARSEAVAAVSRMLARRAKNRGSDDLRKASKMVMATINPTDGETKPKDDKVKRERYPDDETIDTRKRNKKTKPTRTNDNPIRKNVPIDKSLIGARVAIYFNDQKQFYEGFVRRAWANAEPETLYQVRFSDGDQEDYTLDEILFFRGNFLDGKREPAVSRLNSIRRKARKSSDGKTQRKPSVPRLNSIHRKACNSDERATLPSLPTLKVNMMNSVHFELDILTESNNDEWEQMEKHITYKHCLADPKQRRFTAKKFSDTKALRKRRRRENQRQKHLNGMTAADPDSPSARECLTEGTADYDLWLASTVKEVSGVMRQALKAVPLDDLTREQRKRILRSKLVMRVKRDEHGNIEKRKVRLVAMGNSSVKGVHHDWTHAPGASATSIRTLVALACTLRKVISSYDLEQCYLQAPINQPSAKDLFLRPPRELIFRDKWNRTLVFECTANLYGLASGGADSFAHVDKHMISEQGLSSSRGDPCLYAKRSPGWSPHSKERANADGQFLFHSLYTDDGIYFGTPEEEKEFEQKLNKNFKVRINSVCKFILGMRLEQLLWDDLSDEKRELSGDIENLNKLSQRAFSVEIVRLTPEKMWLHEDDQSDSLRTGAPKRAQGEIPDFNAKTVLHPDAPRAKTPLPIEVSKILDESFAAAVKLLQEEGTLADPLVFSELAEHGGSEGEDGEDPGLTILPSRVTSKADPKQLRPMTAAEEIELKELMARYPYRTLIAKINYLARMTRPDLAHAVGVLSRHLQNPGVQAYRGLQAVIRYILNTLDRGIIFHEKSALRVPRFYVDANFPFGRARAGYIACYAGACIDWQSKLSASSAASTAEAEIQAAFLGFCRALATKKDLTLLGIVNEGDAIDIEEDSQAALLNLTGEVLNGGSMKWISNKFLKSIEWVKANLVKVHKCDTKVMWADGLTKQLPLKQHNMFVRYTMGCAT